MNRLSICTQNVIAPYTDRVDTSGWNVGGAITGGWGLRAGHTYTIVNGLEVLGNQQKLLPLLRLVRRDGTPHLP